MSQKKFAGLIAALLGSALLLSGCGSDEPAEYTAEQEKAIVDRIAPVGEVAMEGDAIAAAPVAAAPAGPRSGEDIYKKSCFACHATGASGAPKLGDAAAWKPRADQGMETLLKHAWNGFNAMPPKGTCFDCSEDEIKAAIQHMLDSLK
ncbi:cytochrome c5 family protein [Porticoccaceae bacterium LTM1]|nr:cytochrome c5 family protein [Porticoccaceae bacterium LTM1]